MTINTERLKRECEDLGWSIAVDPDESKLLITGERTSVSVTIAPNHEVHLYCAGPFNEVVSIIGAVAKAAEGR